MPLTIRKQYLGQVSPLPPLSIDKYTVYSVNIINDDNDSSVEEIVGVVSSQTSLLTSGNYVLITPTKQLNITFFSSPVYKVSVQAYKNNSKLSIPTSQYMQDSSKLKSTWEPAVAAQNEQNAIPITPIIPALGNLPYTWNAYPIPHHALVDSLINAKDNSGIFEILDPEHLRIGDVVFNEGILSDINIGDSPQIRIQPVLRQSETLKRSSGNIRKTIQFKLTFSTDYGRQNELVPFLQQSRRAPFLPIMQADMFSVGIEALAIESIEVHTTPGFPNQLEVYVTAYKFDWQQYLTGASDFDLTINWPLFHIWISYPGEDSDYLSNYTYQQWGDEDYPNSDLFIYTPNTDWLDIVNDNRISDLSSFTQNGVNKLYSGVTAIQTGDTTGLSDLSTFSSQDTNSPVGLVRGSDGTQYVAINLGLLGTSNDPGSFIALALGATKQGAADLIVNNPVYNNGTYSLGATGVNLDSSQRAALLYGVQNNSQDPTGTWGFWKVGSRTPQSTQSSSMNSPLEVAAQLVFLDPWKPVFDPALTFTDLIIQEVSSQQSNVLAEISPEDQPNPHYQLLGSSDVTITYQGQCSAETSLQLEAMMRKVADLSIKYRGTWSGSTYGGYCYVRNNIAQTMGMTTAIPLSLTVDTIEGFPNERAITLSFISFSPAQRHIGQPQAFKPSQDQTLLNATFSGNAVAYENLEIEVRKSELYPDLRLPNWKTLSTWVQDLQTHFSGKPSPIWDSSSNQPVGDYSFLDTFPYSQEYLTKAQSLVFDGLTNTLDYSKFLTQPLPNYQITTTSVREGYVDPDFYCYPMGNPDAKFGSDFVESILSTMSVPSGSGIGTSTVSPNVAIHHSTDGTAAFSRFGQLELQLSTGDKTASVLSTQAKKKEQIDPIPASSSKKAAQNSLNYPTLEGPPTTNSTAKGPLFSSTTPQGIRRISPNLKNYINSCQVWGPKYNVPPGLILALIQQESDGGTADYPAEGILQYEPGTAKSVGCNPYDDDDAIRCCAILLRQYLNRFDNNVDAAIGSWNEGPGGGLKYLKGDTNLAVGSNPPIIEYISSVLGYWTSISQDFGLQGPPGPNSGYDTTQSDAIANAPTSALGASLNSMAADINTKSQAQFGTGIIGDITGARGSIGGGIVSTAAAIVNIAGYDYNSYENISNVEDTYVDPTKGWNANAVGYDPIKTNPDGSITGGEDIFWSMRRAENGGRLLRAYPSFLVLVVSGGDILTFWRLFDMFYGVHSIVNIEVFSSRKSAADVARVTFADPYNNLSAQSQDSGIAAENDTRKNLTLNSFPTGSEINSLFSGVEAEFGVGAGKADLDRRRASIFSSLVLEAGNRLHIRMGFGADAASLPIVFNGTISSVKRNSDYIETEALGDGAELTNQLSPAAGDDGFYQNVATAGAGKDPRNIIMDFFTAGSPNLWNFITLGLFSSCNPYGIEHFGNISSLIVENDTGEAGVNVYSGWQDNPVNVTFASQDGFTGPVFRALSGALDLYTDAKRELGTLANSGALNSLGPDATDAKTYLAQYGIGGTGYKNDLEANEGWRILNGEELVGIRMENATPWDVISTLRYVEPEYIRTVVPFGLRSTLFFGKSYWPFHYEYDYKKLAQRDKQGTLTSISFVPNITAEEAFKTRPYMQVHVAHSGYNLVSSNIEATREGWSTVVQSIGGVGGLFISEQSETSLAQFLDCQIFPSDQRALLFQSGLFSTQAQRNTEALYSLNPADLFMSTNVLNNHAVGVLQDNVRDMYKGSIMILGNAYIRPFHLVSIADQMKMISGMVEVKEVTHRMSPESGFVTYISPDCLTTQGEPMTQSVWTNVGQVASRYFISKGAVAFSRSSLGGYLLRKSFGAALIFAAWLDSGIDRTTGKVGRLLLYHTSSAAKSAYSKSKLGNILNNRIDEIRATTFGDGLKIGDKTFLNAQSAVKDFNAALDKEGSKIKAQRVFYNLVPRDAFDKASNSVSQKYINEYKKTNGEITDAVQKEIVTRVAKYLKRFSLQEALLEKLSKKFGTSDETLAKAEKVSLKFDNAANKIIREDTLLSRIANYTYNIPYNDRLGTKKSFGQVLRETMNDIRNNFNISTSDLDDLLKGKQDELAGIVKDSDVAISDLERVIKQFSNGDTEDASALLDIISTNPKAFAAFRYISGLYSSKATIDPEIESYIETLRKSMKAKGISADAVIQQIANTSNQGVIGKYLDSIISKDSKLFQSKNLSSSVVRKLLKALGSTAGETGVAATVAPETGGLSLALELCVNITMGGLVNFIDRRLRARHALMCLPLRSCGKEFSAGIDGHEGAVITDTLGPADNLLATLFDTSGGPEWKKLLLGILGFKNLNYYRDPNQSEITMENLGYDLYASPTDAKSLHESYLDRMAYLNNQGLSINGQPITVNTPTSAPNANDYTNLTGAKGTRYKQLINTLIGEPNEQAAASILASPGYPSGITPYNCLVAVESLLQEAGYGTIRSGSNAIAFGKYLQGKLSLPGNIPPASTLFNTGTGTPPNGAIVIYDNAGGGDGHAAFWVNNTLYGNTDGRLTAPTSGEFAASNITVWGMPKNN